MKKFKNKNNHCFIDFKINCKIINNHNLYIFNEKKNKKVFFKNKIIFYKI